MSPIINGHSVQAMGTYAGQYRWSLDDPGGFWLEAARSMDWDVTPRRALDAPTPRSFRWFPDGRLNICHNAIDRHVAAGHGDRAALIWDSPVTGGKTTITYRELLDQTARFAGVLRDCGVTEGDRVLVYMPMVPEAVVAMLACARIGAVHSVVFGGFASRELAIRIDDCRPTVIVTASCGFEPTRVVPYRPMLGDALRVATHQPESIIVLQRPQHTVELSPHDLDWHQAVGSAKPCDPVRMKSTDPLYILYTSGTTGGPKGVVRDTGGYAVALAWSMRAVYDIAPGDVWWSASDIGWVVGHSYIVYGPLLVGATTVLYEGKPVKTPDAGAFWRVASEHRVKSILAAPTAIRAIRKEDQDGDERRRYALPTLESLYLAGERLDPETYHWACATLGIPVVDHWWQTETGWPVAANPRGLEALPPKPGSPTVALPGYDVRILDDSGSELATGEAGSIVIRLPLPPGALTTLWGDDTRYVDSYLTTYPGYYLTGDHGYIDADGYLFVLGRTDDIINVAGHRLSTGAMEAVVASHSAVMECAVVGVHDDVKGQLPLALVVLKPGAIVSDDALRDDLVAMVRRDIGPVAAFREVAVVQSLPKTRSGKIMRKAIRALADGRDEPIPATIEDPAVLTEIACALRTDHTIGK